MVRSGITEVLRLPGLSKVTGHNCHQGKTPSSQHQVGCGSNPHPHPTLLGQAQSTHIVGMPWI